jgi:hypothetical protein
MGVVVDSQGGSLPRSIVVSHGEDIVKRTPDGGGNINIVEPLRGKSLDHALVGTSADLRSNLRSRNSSAQVE